MSKYLPLCNYVQMKTGWSYHTCAFINLSGGQIIGTSVHISATGGSPSFATGLLAGLAAIFVERALPDVLNRSGVGLTKGGMIIRGGQIAAFAAPYIVSMGLHFGAASSQAAHEKTVTAPPSPNPVLVPFSR
jgi:hypothetical protein